MNGNVNKDNQSWLNPNFAPVCEYVATPEGPSSAVPVMKPGPIIFNILFKIFNICARFSFRVSFFCIFWGSIHEYVRMFFYENNNIKKLEKWAQYVAFIV